MSREGAFNFLIEDSKKLGLDTSDISDGYHTFGELYEHRFWLFIRMMELHNELYFINNTSSTTAYKDRPWRSKLHHDGGACYDGGWFIMGLGTKASKQITYHLPMRLWDFTDFADTLERAPEWDGHTSEDVLKRLSEL